MKITSPEMLAQSLNTNGLLRQYFPKGTDFRQVTNAELRRVVKKLN